MALFPPQDKFWLYMVTDRSAFAGIGKTIFEASQEACAAGISILQYREKNLPLKKRLIEARQLRKIAKKHRVLFIVNDDALLALKVKSNGVHLGQDDAPITAARKLLGKKAVIGITVHSLSEALLAQTQGADYVAVSPVFETKTKQDAGEPVGLGLVAAVKKSLSIPVIGIGGINSKNIKSVQSTGANGAAMVLEFAKQENIKKTVADLRGIISMPKRNAGSATEFK